MHPILHINLGLFAFDVKAYTLLLTLAAVLTVAGAWGIATRRGLPRGRLTVVLLLCVLAGFAGARLLHAATHWAVYRAEPWRFVTLDFNGLALFGGLAGAALVGLGISRCLRLDAWKIADSAALPLGVGIAVARVGCFLNGCCFGKTTAVPWGVSFPFFSNAHLYQLTQGTDVELFSVTPVHPTEFYDAAAALVGAAVVGFILRRRLPRGLAIAAFAATYALGRLLIQPFRVVMPGEDVTPWFYPTLFLAVAMAGALAVAWAVVRAGRPREKLAPAPVSIG